MKRNISLKRMLSMLLIAVMVIGMLPLTALAATDVTLNFQSALAHNGNKRYQIYFDALPDTNDKYWNNNTVYIDGKEVTDGVNYVHLEGKLWLCLTYDAIESGVTTADEFASSHMLHIKKGTAMAGGEYAIGNDVWLKLDGYTVTQLEPVDLTLGSVQTQDGGLNRFVITFNGFADTQKNIYWNNNTVYIDGKAVTGDGVNYDTDDSDGIILYLTYDKIESGVTEATKLGTHTLEIPAGTVLGSYVVNQTLNFQISGNKITQLHTLNFKSGASQDEHKRYLISFESLSDTGDKYWNNNTVYIDGKEVSGDGVHYVHESGMFRLCLSYSLIEEGVTSVSGFTSSHILHIKKGTALGNNGQFAIANDVWLKLDGYEVTETEAPNDNSVTLNFQSGAGQDDATLQRYLISFDGLPDQSNIYWNDNTVYIDGREVSGDGVNYTHDGGKLLLCLTYDVIESGVTTAGGFSTSHMLHIKKGTAMGNNGQYAVANDVWLKLNGYTVTSYEPVDLSLANCQYQDHDNLNRFVITFSGFADTQKNIYWNNNTVYIDGKAVTGEGVNYETNDSDGIILYLTYNNIESGVTEATKLGIHTLEIPAGTILGSYVVNQTLKYQINGGTLTAIPDPDVTVTISNDYRNAEGGTTTGLYFVVSPADGLPYGATPADWTVRYPMTTGGIYVNDEVIDKAQLIKILDNLYYVAFDGANVTFKANDTVKISGMVTSNGYTVAYTEHTFQYDGNGKWTDYYPVTFKLDEAAPGGWQEENVRYLAYLSDDIAGTKAELGNVQLTIDGETATVETAIVGGRYALLLNASCGITEMGEHCIQITAGQKLGQYTATEDAVFYTHINGGIDTTAPTYVTFGFDGGAWQPENNRYLIWLSDDIDGEKIAPNSVKMVLDGELQNVTIALVDNLEGYPNGRLALLLDSACGITEMGEHTVTIAAGQQVGKYVAKESMTAYTHADGSVSGEKRKVSLSIETVTGDDLLYSTKIEWTSAALSKVEQTVAALLGEDELLLGYRYGEDLYRSLCDLPQAENSLTVKAETVSFRVEQTAEIRHGESLAQSGLRFVATLKESDYSKYLFVADSLSKLTGEKADYKIGDGITEDMKTVITKDGYTCFSLALANIPAADYNKTYYAVGAIAVTYADGTEDYVYTNKVSATVYQAAGNTAISSDSRTAYLNGVINLDAHANPIDSYTYDISVANNANGDYVISYTATAKVEALSIIGKRLTASDGVTFGDGKITVPSGLFASALLQEELGQTKNALQIGAYKGPSVGKYTYTDKKGNTTDYSATRDHDQVYADVEDFFGAGFNIWLAEDWIFGANSYSDNDGLSALDLAAEYCLNHGLTGKDIQVLITDSFLNGLLDGYEIAENAGDSVEGYAQIIKTRFELLKNYNPKVNGVEVGTEYNCFAGYILRDEPYYEHLKYYNGWFSFLGADQGQTVDVIANSAKTGTQVSGTVECLGILSQGYTLYFSMLGQSTSKRYVVEGSTSYDTCTTAEYTAYLKAFVDGVNSTVWNHDNMILAFDNYGLNTTVEGKIGSTDLTYTENMSTTWQENMVLVAKLVQEKNPNATFATALRSFGMTRLSNVDSASSWFKSKTWNEYQAFDAAWGQQAMDLQAYTALAHGYTYLNYFSYWENQNQSYSGETFTDACVMWDTDTMTPVKQNMYYWVQNTNAELRAIEDLFGSFTYSGTAAIASGSSYYGGTTGLWTAEDLIAGTAIASLSASADTTVGHYSKDSGDFGEMFVLVNMTHPEKGSSDTVTLTFDSGYTSVIVYTDGEPTMYQLADSAYTVTIPSGEGVIVIPVK